MSIVNPSGESEMAHSLIRNRPSWTSSTRDASTVTRTSSRCTRGDGDEPVGRVRVIRVITVRATDLPTGKPGIGRPFVATRQVAPLSTDVSTTIDVPGGVVDSHTTSDPNGGMSGNGYGGDTLWPVVAPDRMASPRPHNPTHARPCTGARFDLEVPRATAPNPDLPPAGRRRNPDPTPMTPRHAGPAPAATLRLVADCPPPASRTPDTTAGRVAYPVG